MPTLLPLGSVSYPTRVCLWASPHVPGPLPPPNSGFLGTSRSWLSQSCLGVVGKVLKWLPGGDVGCAEVWRSPSRDSAPVRCGACPEAVVLCLVQTLHPEAGGGGGVGSSAWPACQVGTLPWGLGAGVGWEAAKVSSREALAGFICF